MKRHRPLPPWRGANQDVDPELLHNAKLRGEWVEALFRASAARHGLLVYSPWGDNVRADEIICHGSRLSRVQVKSTYFRNRNGYLCNVHGFNGRLYRPGELDFIAAYVIPEDTWYIVPFRAMAHARAAIHLDPRRPHSKYGRYREAWHLLRSRARTLAASA